ncbi:MAG TPA: hypothetical protein VHE99_06825 [Gammaproteobacteria bacterium]|nr:hypothetical protein [Gammaproteobacteria bacterium]
MLNQREREDFGVRVANQILGGIENLREGFSQALVENSRLVANTLWFAGTIAITFAATRQSNITPELGTNRSTDIAAAIIGTTGVLLMAGAVGVEAYAGNRRAQIAEEEAARDRAPRP